MDGLGPFRPAESPRGTKHRKRLPGQQVGSVAPIQDVDVRVTASKPIALVVRPPFPIGDCGLVKGSGGRCQGTLLVTGRQRVAFTPPVLDAAHHFLDAKAELREAQPSLGRGVAPRPPAIDNHDIVL